MKGWLLDVYPAGGDEMVLCLKGEDGKVRLFRDDYTPEFYIGGSDEKLVELEPELDRREIVSDWSYDEKCVGLRDLKKSTVMRVECGSMEKLRNLAKRIARLGDHREYELFNVDVPYAQDYLHGKKLYPLARVELEDPFSLNLRALNPPTATGYDIEEGEEEVWEELDSELGARSRQNSYRKLLTPALSTGP